MRDADVAVVGAGAGGPVVARTLAEAGVSVLLLDAGPWLDPERDYSQLENDMFSMSDGALRWGPSDRSRDPWRRKRSGVGMILQAAGVGGCTRHYNGIASRAHRHSIDRDWPLEYAELAGYYEEIEALLPVHRVARLAPKDARFAEGCRALGIAECRTPDITDAAWGHSFNAILPVSVPQPGGGMAYPDVTGCTLCGHCLIGCGMPAKAPTRGKAKRATDVSMVPAAVATGRCHVIPDAFVTRVLTQSRGSRLRATGVRWTDTRSGAEHEVRTGAVVLAAGSVETPRLWLNSILPDSGAVGRYLTNHYQDFVTGFFPEQTHPDIGQATMAKADFPGYGVMWSEGFAPWGFATALTASGAAFWTDISTVDGGWDFAGRAWGVRALEMILRYQCAATIAISTDDETHPDNRVTLARDWPPDEHGIVPSVSYRPTVRTRERREWLARKAAAVLRAAGAVEVHRTAPDRAVMAHIIGTMRIGTDPRHSVLAPHGEAHDVERLFVADASALSNGIGGAPPSLTTQALALRTARSLLDRYHGEPATAASPTPVPSTVEDVDR